MARATKFSVTSRIAVSPAENVNAPANGARTLSPRTSFCPKGEPVPPLPSETWTTKLSEPLELALGVYVMAFDVPVPLAEAVPLARYAAAPAAVQRLAGRMRYCLRRQFRWP